MQKPKKPSLRNPSFYDFGYHITSTENLPSILKNGLIPNELFDRKGIGPSAGKYPKYSIEIAEYLYNGKIPIYFLTTPSLKYLSEKFRAVMEYEKRSMVMLKVDVSKFDQLPDIDFLRMDDVLNLQYYKTGPNRNIPAIDFETRGKINVEYGVSSLKKNNITQIPPHLRKWMKIYDWGIPVTEFKKNHKLTMDVIATTHTFCIAEPIPVKNIVGVEEFKFQ